MVESLHLYLHDEHYQAQMSCLELTIHTNRLDLLHLLHDGGAVIPAQAFQLAVETAGLDMLRYLDSEKNKAGENFVMDYIASESFEVGKMELLLANNLVQLRARDLHVAIHRHSRRITDLLIRFGCPVNDTTVDNAVAAWDFTLAERLMASHACRPTRVAYEWLFTGGLCRCCFAGFYPAESDEFYIGKLNWILSATGADTGFLSFAEMETDAAWSILLPRVSSAVVHWFKNQCKSKRQRC